MVPMSKPQEPALSEQMRNWDMLNRPSDSASYADEVEQMELEIARIKVELKISQAEVTVCNEALQFCKRKYADQLVLRESDQRHIDRLAKAVLNQAGDNLCWFNPLRALIPPREEFLESCARFHTQMCTENGELDGCKTIAQLEAEIVRKDTEIELLKMKR
jgi:hypothetical protein